MKNLYIAFILSYIICLLKDQQVCAQVYARAQYDITTNSFTRNSPGLSLINNSLPGGTKLEDAIHLQNGSLGSDQVGCEVPQPFAGSVARTYASVGWTGSSGQDYSIQWRAAGSANWNTISPITGSPYTTSNSYSLTGLTSNTAYEWQVQGICPGSPATYSTYSAPQTFTTLTCQLPVNLATSSVRSASAYLIWNAGYDSGNTVDLRYRPVNTPTWTTISSINSTTYALTGLANNTEYEWQLRSICSANESSDFTTSSTFTTFCLIPGGLSSNAGSTIASLYWGFQGFPEPGSTYELQYRTVGSQQWTTLTGPSASSYGSRSLTGLIKDTNYEWRIRLVCSPTSQSDYSAIATFRTGCFAPESNSLQVPYVFSSSAQLSWGVTTDPGTTFDIQYRPTGTSDWTTVSNLTANTSNGSYTLTNLSSNTAYEWQIRSVCSPTESTSFTPGPAFTTRCPTPSAQYSAAQVSSIILQWTQPEAGATYEVRYRTVGAANWTIISNLTSTSTTLSGLVSNTDYEWQLRTLCANGSIADFSTVYTFHTASCGVPYGLQVSINTHSARLFWSFANADAATRYEIWYRSVGFPTWSVLGNLTSTNGNGYVDLSGLANNTAYEWQIKTVCSATESSAFASGPTFTTGCPIPSSLYESKQVNTATLYWNSTGIGISYDMRYRQANTTNWTTISNIANPTTSISGLTGNTTYEWQVRSLCNDNINSDFSAMANFTTYACLAPAQLVNAITTTSARLNWYYGFANANTRYEARYRVTGTTSWAVLSNLTSTNGSGYVDLTNLSINTQYEWQVKTICTETESSDYSAITTFQTLAPCSSMYTVKAGDWSDPTVWSCDRIPISSDTVQIKHAVTLPVSYVANALQMRFDSGQQVRYSANSSLRVGF